MPICCSRFLVVLVLLNLFFCIIAGTLASSPPPSLSSFELLGLLGKWAAQNGL